MVHAKMRGVHSALRNQGGTETSGGLRKKLGKLTNWDRILKGVQAYEAMGKPSSCSCRGWDPKSRT